MTRIVSFILCMVFFFTLTGCARDAFGHETYTNTDSYHKIFDLNEIRFKEEAFELFPKEIESLGTASFYCEWELGIVGSARVEIALSVNYTETAFAEEVGRLKGLCNGKAVYNDQTFQFPAYVTVLGYNHTNYYALVDEQNSRIHYVLLQLISDENIDIDKSLLPNGYGELGEVQGMSYYAYE